MLRQFVVFWFVGTVGLVAVADPVKHALRIRVPIGAGASDESAVFDLFEIGEMVDRMGQQQELPVIVLDRREDQRVSGVETSNVVVNYDDPNLATNTVTVGPETLRRELRPADVNDLFSKRIRANGTGESMKGTQGPADPNNSSVSLRSSADR